MLPTIREIINQNPEIPVGEPVFVGRRVPVRSLFEHLEAGDFIAGFLNGFSSVQREQVISLLEMFKKQLPVAV